MMTGSRDWTLTLDEGKFLVANGDASRAVVVLLESIESVSKGIFWSSVALKLSSGDTRTLYGLPNAQASSLGAAVNAAVAEQRLQVELEVLNRSMSAINAWLSEVSTLVRRADEERRWITYEARQELRNSRPALDRDQLWARIRRVQIKKRLGSAYETTEKSLRLWDADWDAVLTRLNNEHSERELLACKDLFDRVESKPLTQEQTRAVVCFENRVQVVAAAGSGKTSTMVAKAAYAIQRGFFSPNQIVMLAFNKRAAEELKERSARSLERLGMLGITVESTTFHALGLSIIGNATGRKPDIPGWATDSGAGIKKISAIVDQLKDSSPRFRSEWDLFRVVFARDLPAFGKPSNPDVWDRDGRALLLTIDGTRVRSQEEVMIANWLFMNGVKFEYERPYEVDTASPTHRQYRPDFYYPDINLYHEHFALDANGNAPPHFEGYLSGVTWKRQLHQSQSTDLVETTSHLLRDGDWIEHLTEALTSRGIELNCNPDRPVPEGGQTPMEHADLVKLVRTFISHAKSNCLGAVELSDRLNELPKDVYSVRHRMFLAIANPIMQAWDAALAEEGGIDFEDMLNLAAKHLESGRYEAPYLLVMADEFQDASRARARLCRALVKPRGRHLFAVGDDWQSINRFAGADVSVMSTFQAFFGHGQVLKLEQTFRCPQALCDVSSKFVSKNDAQIVKAVRSVAPLLGPVLQAHQVDHRDKLQESIDHFLERVCDGLRDGSIPAGHAGKVSVLVLGRYNAEQSYVPARWQQRFGAWIELTFMSIHRAKGSEADYVILPSMVSRLRGNSFPNTRTDDPVLALAMPSGDRYPLSEERRLFYVALTRARRGVVLFTVRGENSQFLTELLNEKAVEIRNRNGGGAVDQNCPACNRGVIVERNGPYGLFYSCSNYPWCENKVFKSRHGHAAGLRKHT